MRRFSLLWMFVLVVQATETARKEGDRENKIRELHLRHRHRQFAQGELFKNDHLKDFRRGGTSTVAPSALRPPTPAPTPSPTLSPSLYPSAETDLPPFNGDTLCARAEFPPLGQSGTTISGRMFSWIYPTTCDCLSRANFCEYVGTIGDLTRFYEQVGPFRNPSSKRSCASVTLDYGTCTIGARFVQVNIGAFTEFNPDDIGQNYLGSVGDTSSYNEFGFPVQGNEQFYVVIQQVRDVLATDNGEGCEMSVQVQIGPGTCFTKSPTSAPSSLPSSSPTKADVTSRPTVSPLPLCESQTFPPLGSSATTIVERIEGDSFGLPFVETDCFHYGQDFSPRNTFGGAEFYYALLGPFRNPNNEESCFRVSIDLGTCILNGRSLVLVAAHSRFNPTTISGNYLGGFNDPSNTNQAFGFRVKGGETFEIVAQQIGATIDPDNGAGCVLSVVVEVDEDEERCQTVVP